MKKNSLFTWIVLGYEICRVLFVMTAHPEQPIAILPLSWYAGVATLLLPVVLVFLIAKGIESTETLSLLYFLSKTLSIIACIFYILADYQQAIRYGSLNNYYSLKILFGVVIIIVIDVILLFVSLKTEGTHADNSSS